MIKNLDANLQQAIIFSLEETVDKKVELKDFKSIAGGCINSGGRLSTSQGDYFLKWNDAKRYPDMFRKEAVGLTLLQESTPLKVPSVISVGENSQTQFLILEFIEPGKPDVVFWDELGSGLATLHRQTSSTFGLDHNNFIGSLHQDNSQTDNWIDFFIDSRINPQLKLAVDDGKLEMEHMKCFESLNKELPALIPKESPSFLHGDLWSGNLMVTVRGKAALIDPAVYYGHREMELAFTKLFGEFNQVFYESYNEEFQLAPGFDNRVDLYNLYPLLVHVNLFGGGYAHQVVSILKRFV